MDKYLNRTNTIIGIVVGLAALTTGGYAAWVKLGRPGPGSWAVPLLVVLLVLGIGLVVARRFNRLFDEAGGPVAILERQLESVTAREAASEGEQGHDAAEPSPSGTAVTISAPTAATAGPPEPEPISADIEAVRKRCMQMTSYDAARHAEPYVGEWVTVTGAFIDLEDIGGMVVAWLSGNPKIGVMKDYRIAIDAEHLNRFRQLERGEGVTVLGRITYGGKQFYLEHGRVVQRMGVAPSITASLAPIEDPPQTRTTKQQAPDRTMSRTDVDRLQSLYHSQTQLQADGATRPYLGAWVVLDGLVCNVAGGTVLLTRDRRAPGYPHYIVDISSQSAAFLPQLNVGDQVEMKCRLAKGGRSMRFREGFLQYRSVQK